MKKILILGIILFSIPFKVLAHGTEEEHALEQAVNYWSYGLIASLVVLVVFLALFLLTKQKASKISMKNKANRKKHQTWIAKANIYKWVMYGSIVLTVLFLIMTNITNEPGYLANELDGTAQDSVHEGKEEKVSFRHIHGLGYSSDGEEVYVPAHDGLRVFKDGEWTIPPVGEKHDYMGFSMFKDGFYSSGHPAPGSDLANPLGIVKSTDMGETIEMVDLYEEIDFHGMTVGYETEDIYVFNPSENSRMEQPGFYYSTDQTDTWNQAQLQGLEGQATALAAHPTKSGTVAIGTDQGVFQSDDYGDNFQKLSVSDAVSAVSFDHQDNLMVATDEGELIQVNLASGEGNELSIPDLAGDVITYIKQNPVTSDSLVLATSEKDIYFSEDGGKTWDQSVHEGVAQE
ncbi:F510_1955 family glycosylhydrolase [Aquibacillus albus]|uniref:Glycosyl hydrolase n=1 Tax=Aquibacillus albus TaxID=1168171 RepID=A0ABS2MXE5_9BACI|nr:glycosyl hydrolase [Aquibacillus albus]MBM7570559.1 hypothetical protein [Aquibacillus albus]